MKIPSPAPKRVVYTTGNLLPHLGEKVDKKYGSPLRFSQQIDVVFPLSPGSDLQNVMSKLAFTYHRQHWKLYDFIDFALKMRSRAHSIQGEAGTTAFRALTGVGLPGPSDNDAWCLDEDRLVLTMGTETYQRFFKTGTAMPWKQHKDVHWFSFTLEELSKLSPKLRTAFKTWDERRGRWDVVYDYDGPGMSDSHEAGQVHIMQPTVRIMQHIYVPVVSITQRPSSADEREDWVDEMSALFEWVGMACLGSQRLQSHDNPDPYIAVYEAPPGSQTANVAHIQWRGFITLRVFEEIMGALAGDTTPMVAVTGHGLLQSPIINRLTQRRVPSIDSENTWSMVISRPKNRDEQIIPFILAECVSQFDSHWGQEPTPGKQRQAVVR